MSPPTQPPGSRQDPPNDPIIEEAATAWRPTRDGGVGSHPAWHDLSEEDRHVAFDVAVTHRAVEANLDPEGLSSTARAVLARITGD